MKRSIWAVIALLTCPCHVALVGFLFAGSATGALISNHMGWVFLILAVIFGLSIFMAMKSDQSLPSTEKSSR